MRTSVLTMTRLTRDNAFNGIFHRYMTPDIDNIIIRTGTRIIKADHRSNPRRMNITRNVAAMLRLRFLTASVTMCKYCSNAM